MIHPVLGCHSLVRLMLDAVSQLLAQATLQIMFQTQTLRQVIQEDSIDLVHHEKVPCLKDHLHIHPRHPLLVLPTVVVDRQR